jgi:hypothetical protein
MGDQKPRLVAACGRMLGDQMLGKVVVEKHLRIQGSGVRSQPGLLF